MDYTFKPLAGTRYLVTTTGQLIDSKTNKIIKGVYKDKVRSYNILIDGSFRHITSHDLVKMVFGNDTTEEVINEVVKDYVITDFRKQPMKEAHKKAISEALKGSKNHKFKGFYNCLGIQYESLELASIALSIPKATIYYRCKNGLNGFKMELL